VTIDINLPFPPRDAVVIAAFEGWNDAANASTAALDHLIDVFDAEFVGEIDPDEFYDFQVNRPMVGFVSDPVVTDAAADSVVTDAGVSESGAIADGSGTTTSDSPSARDTDDDTGLPARVLTWPTTRIYLARPDGFDRDLVFVRGIEPNMRWRAFTAELLAAGDTLSAQMWIVLGALLADVPHTRPIPVNGNSSDPSVVAGHNVEPSRYEGPSGIQRDHHRRLLAAGDPGGVVLGRGPALRVAAAVPKGEPGTAACGGRPAGLDDSPRRPARECPRVGARRGRTGRG